MVFVVFHLQALFNTQRSKVHSLTTNFACLAQWSFSYHHTKDKENVRTDTALYFAIYKNITSTTVAYFSTLTYVFLVTVLFVHRRFEPHSLLL
jgi:hypothetical protein